MVKVGQFTSNSITLNVGAPQGCVLSPLLYSVYTHTTACPLTAPLLLLNLLMILWFWASFPTMMRLHTWMRYCLSLNVSKTKELIVDFRKQHQRPYTPLMISGTPVVRVSSFKLLTLLAEEIQGLTSNPENFLFSGHRKCTDSVHLSVVW